MQTGCGFTLALVLLEHAADGGAGKVVAACGSTRSAVSYVDGVDCMRISCVYPASGTSSTGNWCYGGRSGRSEDTDRTP